MAQDANTDAAQAQDAVAKLFAPDALAWRDGATDPAAVEFADQALPVYADRWGEDDARTRAAHQLTIQVAATALQRGDGLPDLSTRDAVELRPIESERDEPITTKRPPVAGVGQESRPRTLDALTSVAKGRTITYKSPLLSRDLLTDAPGKITLHNQGQTTIRATLDLAEEKGWKGVRVTGSVRVRRALWLEASLRGLAIQGYEPTDSDRRALLQAASPDSDVAPDSVSTASKPRDASMSPLLAPVLENASLGAADRLDKVAQALGEMAISVPDAERQQVVQVIEEGIAGGQPHVEGNDPTTRATNKLLSREQFAAFGAARALARHAPDADNPFTDDRLRDAYSSEQAYLAYAAGRRDPAITGQLVKHGAAPYQFKEDANPSYYAVVEQSPGKQSVLWGVDLERALSEAGAEVGDTVALETAGAKTVKVPVAERDAGGAIVGTTTKDAQRNQWESRVLARDASQQPELAAAPERAGSLSPDV